MDERTNGDFGERHAVAGLDVHAGLAGDDGVADLEALGSEDVGLGAIDIVEKRDASGAVRVVLDGRDLGRHVVLQTLEVDATIHALVAAALVTDGDAAVVVTATLLAQRLSERLLGLRGGNLGEVRDRLEAPACARRLEVLDCHYFFPFCFRWPPC